MTRSPEDRFRDLVESMIGMEYPGSLDEVAGSLNVDIDDPGSWAWLERRWEAVKPDVDRLRSVDDGPFGQVEPVFQHLAERDPRIFDPPVLATYPPGVRMLISTRVIEGQVDNGGWPAVFYNGVDGHLPAAVEGYRLLGLADHAAVAERVRAHARTDRAGGAPTDATWDDVDAAWNGLPGAEEARARYVLENAGEFPA